MKKHLLACERKLKKYSSKLRWLHDECPLVFLILVWGACTVIGLAALILTYSGIISHEDFNIVLSMLALAAAFILSIVVVL